MNNKKISFIMCINDETYADEQMNYLNSLVVPDGYDVDVFMVRDAHSMCSGYNEAMHASDAKYKVYMHQDVFIVNRNFILDILDVFDDDNIGMLGMVGQTHLPDNCIMWNAPRVGKLYATVIIEKGRCEFMPVKGKCCEVEAIDGLLMATQYDIPWREDLFKDWDFYDISQSQEFIRAGYKVVVPNQTNPWCIHDDDINNYKNYYKNRLIFKHEYKPDNIIERYTAGTIDDEFLLGNTYKALANVELTGDIKLFKDISNAVFDANLRRIRSKETKKIVFFLKDSAEWSCEALYQIFSSRDEYEVSIAVAPYFMGTEQTITHTYLNTIKYFEDRDYSVIAMYDQKNDEYKTWQEIGMPDIVFHLNPHYEQFESTCNICEFPLSMLNIYIPYSFLIYDGVQLQFNQLSHHLFWKIFCETPMHRQMAAKYSDIGDSNVISCGYVKMDSFYDTNALPERLIWKISPGAKDDVKRIIYAPHWSVKDTFTGFGNFDKIYMELYEYAKSHETTTSWVFRPHPLLRAGAVQQGIFESEKAYDEYLGLWNALPNAQVIEGGTYYDIFESSDAMVLDSISFMAEYMYVHKPMLFLTKDRNTFNEFGKELVKVLYTAEGNTIAGIEQFMADVVMGDNDYMKDAREEFFTKYLDYAKTNGMLAGEYIARYIDSEINIQGINRHD